MLPVPAKLRSRKLWLSILGVVLPVLGSYLSEDIDLHEALKLSVSAVIAYCVSQGYVDGKTMEGWIPAEDEDDDKA